MSHIPVLLGETIGALDLKEGDVVVDATLGSGGHSNVILEKIGERGTLIAIDVDQTAIDEFRKNHQLQKNCLLVNDNFVNLEKILDELGIEKVDAVLADLGWRIEQIENQQYGMSFRKDAPLDMRLGVGSRQEPLNPLNAYEIVNEWPEEKLADIFRKYGEERYSKLAAREIIKRRKEGPIKTTLELSDVLAKSLGFKYKKSRIHPATKVFQALRIVVNKELENLEKFLPQTLSRLKKGGRVAIIAFHSLEDRIVKEFFRSNAGGCVCPKEFPICVCGKKPVVKRITGKPIVAGDEERKINSRSRSARLRVAEKI